MHADLVTLGFTGSYSRAAAFAREWRADRHREQQTTGRGTFVPLSFSPGAAFQFNWSEDFAVLGGECTKLQVAHIKLSHSRAFLLRAYRLQTHDMRCCLMRTGTSSGSLAVCLDAGSTTDGMVAALLQTASQCAKLVVRVPPSGEDGEMKDMIIGVDLAKRVFQIHGASASGEVRFRKKLTREQFRVFMSKQAPCCLVFEACGSASYWAREMGFLGHEVRLIAPQYVRPFVKRQKDDAADAEAIVIAARQPEMRFVAAKTVEQQARAALFRGRERLVQQRTEDVNARAVLYEHGYVFPIGVGHLKRMEALVEAETCDLPAMIREECQDLLVQIAEKTARIAARDKKLKELAAQSDMARRLQTMPGVGPLTSLAIEAFGPERAQFKTGRDFAAWLGLVPRQHSSGDKERLGRISKAGQADIRRLLIIGAMSRLNWMGQRTIFEGSWLAKMLARKPKLLVAIALANKMARQIWAMTTKNEDYRDPALTAAA